MPLQPAQPPHDERGRPDFLWSEDMGEDEFRSILRGEKICALVGRGEPRDLEEVIRLAGRKDAGVGTLLRVLPQVPVSEGARAFRDELARRLRMELLPPDGRQPLRLGGRTVRTPPPEDLPAPERSPTVITVGLQESPSAGCACRCGPEALRTGATIPDFLPRNPQRQGVRSPDTRAHRSTPWASSSA